MTDISNKRHFTCVFSPERVSFAVESVMHKIIPLKNVRYKNSIVPTLIHLHIEETDRRTGLRSLRMFLRHLRKIQERYFVRFVTDLLWAAESDCADIFYTYDGNIRDVSDIEWHVRILDNDHIRMTTHLMTPSKTHMSLHDLTKRLRSFTNDLIIRDMDDIHSGYDFIESFYERIHIYKDIEDVENHFHVLIIADEQYDGKTKYYPLPIIGMNHLDAARKYKESFRGVLNLYNEHDDVLTNNEDACPDEVIKSIISLIVSNEREASAVRHREQTYALSELLFGYLTQMIDNLKCVSTHDIVLFTVVGDYPHYTRTLMASMDGLLDEDNSQPK